MRRKYGLWAPPVGFTPRRGLDARLRVGDIVPPERYQLLPLDALTAHEQGYTASCAAHATAVAIRAATGARYEPSVRWLYRCRDIHRDGDRDEGTYLSAMHRYCDDFGWCEDDAMPWSDAAAITLDEGRRNAWINARARIDARLRAWPRRGSVIEYAVPANPHAIKVAMCTGHPIVMGGTWTDNALTYRVLSLDEPPLELTGAPEGGHATALLGYTPDGAIGLNSWGCTWGYHGWFLLGWESVCTLSERYAIQVLSP